MQNFKIRTQIDNELEDFFGSQIQLAQVKNLHNNTARYLDTQPGSGYMFNQHNTLAIIDLYYNSRFEKGFIDSNGQRKIFLNIGKFRCEVASKQIDLDMKDFRFIPDDYAAVWIALMQQKEFKEWAKETWFSSLLNEGGENFPKYGTLVGKKMGKDQVDLVPLQTLRNEQTAESLNTASYVIEEHADMPVWELAKMKKQGKWDISGLSTRIDKAYTVYERRGYVPLSWLKSVTDKTLSGGDKEYVDALVITTNDGDKNGKGEAKILYAQEITERPYEEEHWNKQHGRWLGLGVMEDLVENQRAENVAVNLEKRAMAWSAKKVFQSKDDSVIGKNLVKHVPDGAILEVGPDGDISQVNVQNQGYGDFQAFINKFENNADQKAFTYDVTTGNTMPSNTPFRLGVILRDAVNSYYGLKQEKLGIFYKKIIINFLLPQFLKNMGDKEHTVAFYEDEEGYESLKQAAVDMMKTEAAHQSLLAGKPIDLASLERVIEPMQALNMLLFKISKDLYKNAKSKFDLVVTGEQVNIQTKVETLISLFQIYKQNGDPRADYILKRIAVITGENPATFLAKIKTPEVPAQPQPQPQGQGSAVPPGAAAVAGGAQGQGIAANGAG
jgi:hypothetical protein